MSKTLNSGEWNLVIPDASDLETWTIEAVDGDFRITQQTSEPQQTKGITIREGDLVSPEPDITDYWDDDGSLWARPVGTADVDYRITPHVSLDRQPRRSTIQKAIIEDDGSESNPQTGTTYSNSFSGEAVDATGEIARLDTRTKQILDIALEATASDADYVIDASPDGSTWFNGFETFSSTGDIKDTLRVGASFVRIRVDSASATGGATADGFLEAS